MFTYPIRCYEPGCGNLAEFKIAARWSDGNIEELKTYGLCCAGCLPPWYLRGLTRQAQCRLAPGETLESPCIFRMETSDGTRRLVRREDLESACTTAPGA